MTSPRARFPWLRAGVFGAAALALVMAACRAPGPPEPSPMPRETRMEPVRTETSSEVEAMSVTRTLSPETIRSAVQAHFPEVLQAAATDTARLLFVQAADDEIVRHGRTQLRGLNGGADAAPAASSRIRQAAGLTDAQLRASLVDAVQFSAGEMGAGRVEVVWIRQVAPGERVVTTEVDTTSAPAGMRIQAGVRERRPGEISVEQARAYVQRYMPEVARNGPPGERVWFLADAGGRVVRHGRGRVREMLDANKGNLATVQTFSGQSVVLDGHEIPVTYAQLKQ